MFGARPKTTSRNVTHSRSTSGERSVTRTQSNTSDLSGKSRNSTPSKSGRGASTPVHGQSPKAPEFSFNASAVSTVEAVDVSGGSEKSNVNPPKLLKSLGPQQIPRRNEKTALKTSSGKTVAKPAPKKVAAPKEPQVDLRAMYMVYVQQLYLNHLLEQKKEQVLKEGEEQLLQLWGLVKDAKEEAEEMESREKLVKRYIELSESCDKLEPVLTDISGTLDTIRPNYESLASSFDSARHQVPLQNFCQVTPVQVAEVDRILQNNKLATGVTPEPNMSDYEMAKKLTGEMNRNVERGLALLEKCQDLATCGTDLLGEQLALEMETSVKQLKLSDIEL